MRRLPVEIQVHYAGLVNKRTLYRARLVRVPMAKVSWEGWTFGRWMVAPAKMPRPGFGLGVLLVEVEHWEKVGRRAVVREFFSWWPRRMLLKDFVMAWEFRRIEAEETGPNVETP